MLCVGVWLSGAAAEVARGQEVRYYIGGAPLQSAPLYYNRLYQGTTWEWSPNVGWYRHEYYTYTPIYPSGCLSYPATNPVYRPLLIYPW
jgi:hypothetical protein